MIFFVESCGPAATAASSSRLLRMSDVLSWKRRNVRGYIEIVRI